MPMVPPNVNQTGTGVSPMISKPSESNLLMAAAQMHSINRLAQPNPKLAGKHKSNRPLKVVK